MTINRILEITPAGILDKLMTYDEYLTDARLTAQREKRSRIGMPDHGVPALAFVESSSGTYLMRNCCHHFEVFTRKPRSDPAGAAFLCNFYTNPLVGNQRHW